jgi:hypothetical protein
MLWVCIRITRFYLHRVWGGVGTYHISVLHEREGLEDFEAEAGLWQTRGPHTIRGGSILLCTLAAMTYIYPFPLSGNVC